MVQLFAGFFSSSSLMTMPKKSFLFFQWFPVSEAHRFSRRGLRDIHGFLAECRGVTSSFSAHARVSRSMMRRNIQRVSQIWMIWRQVKCDGSRLLNDL